MKKQEIKVYTILSIDKNIGVVALESYTNKEKANESAKRRAEAWGDDGNVAYLHSINRGLMSSKYLHNGKEIVEYKVIETQLFI